MLYIVCALILISCHKNQTTDTAIAIKKPLPVDSIIGTYNCNIVVDTEISVGGPPTISDSTYAGVMTVTKLDDSTIRVSVDNYPISHGILRYTKANEQHTSGDPHDAFTEFHYFPPSDSATLSCRTYRGGSGGFVLYQAFINGKKN